MSAVIPGTCCALDIGLIVYLLQLLRINTEYMVCFFSLANFQNV